MKNLWNRFLVWVGIRKVNPHNLTAQDVQLENVKSPISGRQEIRRVAPPPRYQGGRSAGSASSRQAVSSTPAHRDNDLLDGLTTYLVVDAVVDAITQPAMAAPVEQVFTPPEPTAIQMAPSTNFGGSSSTSFDSTPSTSIEGDGFFKSVGDAIGSIGESISDAASNWSD